MNRLEKWKEVWERKGREGKRENLGIGLALNKPDMDMVVIAGDGEILMSLGTLTLMNKLNCKTNI